MRSSNTANTLYVQQYAPNPLTAQPVQNYVPHEEEASNSEEHGHCTEARAELNAYGFPAHHKAHIAIALDISNSMENPNQFFTSGKIAKLIDKVRDMAVELSPEAKHSVRIFPFAKVAFPAVVFNEHDDAKAAIDEILKNAATVHEGTLSTNYNAVVKSMREWYFGSSARSDHPVSCEGAPVFCVFVTDGEPKMEIPESMNQFRNSVNNAIFFKFIALHGVEVVCGKQVKLNFSTLKSICKLPGLPNRSLLELNDPDDLTLRNLFMGYRPWAEAAHEKGVLVNDPEFHDGYDYSSMIIFGAIGIVLTPLVIAPILLPTLPLAFAIALGAAAGITVGAVVKGIKDCIWPQEEHVLPKSHDSSATTTYQSVRQVNSDEWNRLRSAPHSVPQPLSTALPLPPPPYPGYQPQPSAPYVEPSYQPPAPYA